MQSTLLYQKILSLPDNLKSEVDNFVEFLLQKNRKKSLKTNAKFGSGKGMFVIKPGFDEPLEDFKDYM